MSDAAAAYDALTTHIGDLETLEEIGGLLAWDQQVMLPPKGAAARGHQSSLLSRIAHERLTDPRVGGWLDLLEATELTPVQAACVRNTRRSYDRATKVSSDLVGRLAQAQSDGFQAWVRAKTESDFAAFQPQLELILDLTREKAAVIDPTRQPYDVLLEEFDPGTTVASLRTMFARLRTGLVELLDAIGGVAPVSGLQGTFPAAAQRAVHNEVIQALGYDLEAGRLDPAEHPFTVGMGSGDTRITTHLYEDDLLFSLGGTVHEAGHAMYEQGLPKVEHAGTTVGEAASYGLHESQSRFWENFIGRSLPFFQWFEGRMRPHFGADTPTAQALYQAANRVEPGLVRVAADEVTYNLHIIVRFEIEVALLEGKLAVADLPEAWNAKYAEYLGVTPPDNARGVLQDVHWSGGAIAYFPSYTLGNLYAASLATRLVDDLPDLWSQVEAGEFGAILGWLREHVHAKGHLLEAPEIVRGVVGERDMVDDLLTHLWGRHGALYGVKRPAG